MQCMINGEKYSFDTDMTISILLKHLDIDENRIIVEHNDELIKKHLFRDSTVKNNDRLELLEFVGGG